LFLFLSLVFVFFLAIRKLSFDLFLVIRFSFLCVPFTASIRPGKDQKDNKKRNSVPFSDRASPAWRPEPRNLSSCPLRRRRRRSNVVDSMLLTIAAAFLLTRKTLGRANCASMQFQDHGRASDSFKSRNYVGTGANSSREKGTEKRERARVVCEASRRRVFLRCLHPFIKTTVRLFSFTFGQLMRDVNFGKKGDKSTRKQRKITTSARKQSSPVAAATSPGDGPHRARPLARTRAGPGRTRGGPSASRRRFRARHGLHFRRCSRRRRRRRTKKESAVTTPTTTRGSFSASREQRGESPSTTSSSTRTAISVPRSHIEKEKRSDSRARTRR